MLIGIGTAMTIAYEKEHLLSLFGDDNIQVEKDDHLIYYYPNFSTLDLAYGPRVPIADNTLYCCAAAFTAKCLDTFSHNNVRCNHVSDGHLYQGSEEAICNGVFTFYDGCGHFDTANQAALNLAASNNGMGFKQILIIKDFQITSNKSINRLFRKEYVFRALCEKDDKLCIVESRDKIPYEAFVQLLANAQIRNAIYLDMGGWSHACYRDNFGEIVTTNSDTTRFASNWLIFRK